MSRKDFQFHVRGSRFTNVFITGVRVADSCKPSMLTFRAILLFEASKIHSSTDRTDCDRYFSSLSAAVTQSLTGKSARLIRIQETPRAKVKIKLRAVKSSLLEWAIEQREDESRPAENTADAIAVGKLSQITAHPGRHN